jgi:hypothetical protein
MFAGKRIRVKHLSSAPHKGRLLTSPTNIRLGWKGLPMKNTSLLQKFVNYDPKMFYNIRPRAEFSTLGVCMLVYDNKNGPT